mmetsp:Transcript_2730/g.4265  ORF Transcript_2730/g.4265 Transcript_2730/m.4265 type:complete len:88 (-) Transcript_2730:100-363(-)
MLRRVIATPVPVRSSMGQLRCASTASDRKGTLGFRLKWFTIGAAVASGGGYMVAYANVHNQSLETLEKIASIQRRAEMLEQQLERRS